MSPRHRRLLVLAAVALAAPSSTNAFDRVTGREFASRSEVIASHGMAATSQPLATQVALDILKAGGTAVDAAIAANATLGLMEPTGNGIGGDLFAIVWDAKTKRLYGLNASGRSPRSLTLEHFKSLGLTQIPSRGPLPVTVPGCVDGWFELHQRFGKLPMKRVLAPAIGYATDGFPVSELIAYYWDRSVPLLQKYPGFTDIFTIAGRAPRKGEIFKNPALAHTYDLLARKGRDAFYRGEIARTIGEYMHANGGFLSADDLAAHRSEWVDPVSTNYRGYDVWEMPPNTSGIAALEVLNILEGYDFARMGFGSADHIHLVVEAIKLAFEDAAQHVGDPALSSIPVATLTSKEYAAKRRAAIDPARAAQRVSPGLAGGSDTIYLTVADKDGSMVSLIQSNYRGMGSGMTPTGLGFILQDRGELFELTDGLANTYAPGKRPFHTIIPAFITRDAQPVMSFGVMGGSMQPQGHVQIVMNLIDFGMNLQEAGDAPRFRVEGHSWAAGERMEDGGTVFLETGFAMETQRELAARGHRISFGRDGFGGYQAIRRDAALGIYLGASESRKDGQAAGY